MVTEAHLIGSSVAPKWMTLAGTSARIDRTGRVHLLCESLRLPCLPIAGGQFRNTPVM